MSDLFANPNTPAKPKAKAPRKKKEEAPVSTVPDRTRIAQLSGILSGFRVEMGRLNRTLLDIGVRCERIRQSGLFTDSELKEIWRLDQYAEGMLMNTQIFGIIGDNVQASFDSRTCKT